MRVLCLVLIFQVSSELQCDKTNIIATVGRELNVACHFNGNQYRYSKKYWCLGESRSTCEILMDTDGYTTVRLRNRAQIIRTGYKSIHIVMKKLQKEDAGIYWVGIDKIYADIMFSIEVQVTEEAVIRPLVWSVGSPLQTCQGESVVLRCKTERGTGVKYSWFREAHPEDVLLESSSDLSLHCGNLVQDAQIFCVAQNVMSREQSKPIFLHLLQTGQENCMYLLTSDDLESYNCRTTTSPPTTTIPTTCPVEISSTELITQTTLGTSQSIHVNQTFIWKDNFFFRSWTGVPAWYDIARWILFIIMLSSIALVHRFIKTSSRGQRLSHKHLNHRRL